MTTAVKVEAPSVQRVVVARLERIRRGKRTAFEATVPKPAAEPQPARAAITLAFAHAIRRAIDAGEIRDQAQAAHEFGMTRARVTQLLDLTFLEPRIQEAVLELMDASEPFTERMLRDICRHESWRLQQEQCERSEAQRGGTALD